MSERRVITLGANLDLLTKRTKNIADVLERLEEYDVLTRSEIDHLNCCSDEETSICMLYSMIAQKPASNFNLLLYVLQDTDNDELSRYLENSLRNGQLHLKEQQQQQKRSEEKVQRTYDIDSLLISGAELGISELLAEYPKITRNWKGLFQLLKLPNSCLKKYKYDNNFIIQSTLILRDYTDHLKKRATVGNLCSLLENEGLHECTGRIRRMFDRYMECGLGFDFPHSGSFTIKDKIGAIISILQDNVDFLFNHERLLLMLNLPLEMFSEFIRDTRQGTGADFPRVADKILNVWNSEDGESSTDRLASLLAINGHFCSIKYPLCRGNWIGIPKACARLKKGCRLRKKLFLYKNLPTNLV